MRTLAMRNDVARGVGAPPPTTLLVVEERLASTSTVESEQCADAFTSPVRFGGQLERHREASGVSGHDAAHPLSCLTTVSEPKADAAADGGTSCAPMSR